MRKGVKEVMLPATEFKNEFVSFFLPVGVIDPLFFLGYEKIASNSRMSANDLLDISDQ